MTFILAWRKEIKALKPSGEGLERSDEELEPKLGSNSPSLGSKPSPLGKRNEHKKSGNTLHTTIPLHYIVHHSLGKVRREGGCIM